MQGRVVRNAPEVVKKIIQAGHEVGNHTWTHPDLTFLSAADIRYQVLKNDEEVYKIAGYSMKPLLRCPGGASNQRVRNILFDLGYSEIFWSIDPKDWSYSKSLGQIIQNILNNLQPGAIVVLHNTGPYTVSEAKALIPLLQERGYTIVPVSQLFD